ncbi:hypothetical protein [Olivibacter domesticus]|nr:hypothetical protein [Olivibacter domesticus]
MIKRRKINPSMTILLSIALLSSCNNASTSGESNRGTTKLVPIVRNSENPSSIFLGIVDKVEGDTSISYVAKGLYLNDTVGFIVEVNKTIPAGINSDGSVNEKDGFKTGSVTFKKSGMESDLFVSALGQLWHVNGIDKMKTEPIQPLAFFSNKKPVNLDKSSTNSFKLFFDQKSSNPGEIFFTFDTYKRSIEFQEKDAKYRSTIAHAFAQ